MKHSSSDTDTTELKMFEVCTCTYYNNYNNYYDNHFITMFVYY